MDAHPLDEINFVIQCVDIPCRHTVGDENNCAINVRSLLVASTKHFKSCYFETAGHVRVLFVIVDSVHGCQYLGSRRILTKLEVNPRFVTCTQYTQF